ncbi:MAG: class I SAM-dependent methyltransferase [Opitutales bacterium]|nr:class I SAM-dependent methyltransferase [Opitutales bacterium]
MLLFQRIVRRRHCALRGAGAERSNGKERFRVGDHLLDIGCGWGGLAKFAAEHYGCRVTGVNISAEQLAFARSRGAANPGCLPVRKHTPHRPRKACRPGCCRHRPSVSPNERSRQLLLL